MLFAIAEVKEQSTQYQQLMLAAETLAQKRYIPTRETHIEQSILLGAFADTLCLGFLRFYLQIIGSDVRRPPIQAADGRVLREGFVEAFGVLPAHRRHGIGQALQEYALSYCRNHGCYQIRSRSPVTSTENYALKLKLGYAIHPSDENDSYYFIKRL